MERNHRTLDATERRTIAMYRDLIGAVYDIADIIAFGSRVRGDHRPDSDLDLAIILNGAKSDRIDVSQYMAGQAFDILLETGILVQAVPLSKDDLISSSNFANPALIKSILAEGVRVQ